MVLDILTYSGDTVNGIFEAIARMFGSRGYRDLIYITFSAAYIYTIITQISNTKIKESLTHLFLALLFVAALVTQTTSVTIIDVTLNQSKKIDNIPLGIAFLGSFISTVTDKTTEIFETQFSVPDGVNSFRKSGTLFAAQIIKKSSEASIMTPRLEQNFRRFTSQCIIPDVRIKARYSLDDLVASPNAWELIKANTSKLRGFEYDSGGYRPEFKICREGALMLDADLTREATNYQNNLSYRLSGKSDEAFNAEKLHLVRRATLAYIPEVHSLLTNMAGDSFNILKQHMVRNYLLDSPEKNAQIVGATAAAQSYGLARAKLSQENSTFISGALAPANLVYLYSIFQAFSYAAFAIVVLLVPFPMGFSIISKYIGLLLWVHSWPIVFAIINYIQSEKLYSVIAASARFVDPNTLSAISGWTLFNSSSILEANRSIAITTGFMVASVPMITLVIVYGSGQAVNFASQWFSKSDRAGDVSGDAMTHGDVSGGNVNLDNRTISNDSRYHVNTKPTYNGGAGSFDMPSGSKLDITADGTKVLNQMPGMSQTASSFRVSAAMSSSLQAQSQHAEQAMFASQAHYSNALSNATDKSMQLAMNQGISASSTTGFSNQEAVSINDAMGETRRLVNKFAQENNITESQSAKILASVNGSVNGGAAGRAVSNILGVNLSANGSIGFDSDASSREVFNKAQDFSTEHGLDHKLDLLTRASKDISFNSSNNQGESLVRDYRSSLNELERSSSEYNASKQEYYSASQVSQLSKTQNAAFDTNLQQFTFEKLSAMPDEHGHLLGASRADQILKDPNQAKGYIEQIASNHRTEIASMYQQGFNLSSSNIDNIHEHNTEGVSNIGKIADNYKNSMQHVTDNARDRNLDLNNSQFVSNEAINKYETTNSLVKDKFSDLSQEVMSKGNWHAKQVEEKSDLRKKGLTRRMLSNVVSSKKKDK